jgi:hypothetical protein
MFCHPCQDERLVYRGLVVTTHPHVDHRAKVIGGDSSSKGLWRNDSADRRIVELRRSGVAMNLSGNPEALWAIRLTMDPPTITSA